SMVFQRSSTLSEIVTSLTGYASSPFSIQKPWAPREKSPVTALKPKPIIDVTYWPLGVSFRRAALLIDPGRMIRFEVVGPALPPTPRPALPVDFLPSLRAL